MDEVKPAAAPSLPPPHAETCPACGAPTLKPGEKHAVMLPTRQRPDFFAEPDEITDAAAPSLSPPQAGTDQYFLDNIRIVDKQTFSRKEIDRLLEIVDRYRAAAPSLPPPLMHEIMCPTLTKTGPCNCKSFVAIVSAPSLPPEGQKEPLDMTNAVIVAALKFVNDMNIPPDSATAAFTIKGFKAGVEWLQRQFQQASLPPEGWQAALEELIALRDELTNQVSIGCLFCTITVDREGVEHHEPDCVIQRITKAIGLAARSSAPAPQKTEPQRFPSPQFHDAPKETKP